jgi:hypothetical protein
MNPILRDYQSDLISRIFYQWQTHCCILAQMIEYKPGWAFYRWQEQQRGMAA